jgi:uncharacterized protein (TIGR03435 family)
LADALEQLRDHSVVGTHGCHGRCAGDAAVRGVLEQVVYDETKIEGLFYVNVSWRQPNAPPDDPRPASAFTAVEEQLGLKLTPQRRPVEFLVIESLDRATPQP